MVARSTLLLVLALTGSLSCASRVTAPPPPTVDIRLDLTATGNAIPGEPVNIQAVIRNAGGVVVYVLDACPEPYIHIYDRQGNPLSQVPSLPIGCPASMPAPFQPGSRLLQSIRIHPLAGGSRRLPPGVGTGIAGVRIVHVERASRHEAALVVGAAGTTRSIGGVRDSVDAAKADVAVMAVEAGDAGDVAVAAGPGSTGAPRGPDQVTAVACMGTGTGIARRGMAFDTDDIGKTRMLCGRVLRSCRLQQVFIGGTVCAPGNRVAIGTVEGACVIHPCGAVGKGNSA